MNNVTAEVVQVTPKMAEQWLKNGVYQYQRPIKERHVTFLANEMTAKRFKQDTAIRFGILNSMQVLTDGQHRLHAMLRTDISHTMVIIKTIMNSHEELAENYIEIDINAYRSWADAFRALAGVRGIKVGLNMAQINALHGAVKLIYRGFMNDAVRDSNTLMFNKCLEWLPEAQAYFMSVKYATSDAVSIMKRMHLVALGIVTIKFAKDYGPLQFWQQVAHDDGIRASDIRKLLHNRLIQSKIQTSIAGQKNMTAGQVLWYAIRAWNAYVKKEEIKLLKLPAEAPAILFTPFDYSMTVTQYRKCFENSNWGERWTQEK